ncbi:MAG: MBL fold metallo-hydrolase [Clostridia bacterium]|nr:MBL fold metallo-hydrolase [Clostridia bacterium]
MRLTCLGRYGPYPPVGGGTSAYLLQSGETALLLDCGAGAVARVQAYTQLDRLDALLFSHLHDDHMGDSRVLAYALAVLRAEPLPVYCPCEPRARTEELQKTQQFKTVVINEEDTITINGLTITFCRTQHPVLCYAMRITDGKTTLVYSGDIARPDELIALAAGADVLLCDAAFTRANQPANAPHMCAQQAAGLAGQAGVKRLLLTHLHPKTDEESLLNEAKAVFINTAIIKENDTLVLS